MIRRNSKKHLNLKNRKKGGRQYFIPGMVEYGALGRQGQEVLDFGAILGSIARA